MSSLEEKTSAPESPFNKKLLEVLTDLNVVPKSKPNSPLIVSPNGISMNSGNDTLVTVTPTDILVVGNSFQNKLASSGNQKDNFPDKFQYFISSISNRIVRLNHMGVSYFIDDLGDEEKRIADFARKANIPLQKDMGAEEGEAWLFMGDATSVEKPLFEFVLNKGEANSHDLWRPHFQIDLDTTMTIDEIHSATQLLRPNFIHWELNIPDAGTVLAMGILGNISGTKISLGLGTNTRDTAGHRKGMEQIA